MATKLELTPDDARLFIIVDKRWKFIHAEGGFRPMLFDRENDPNKFNDLGDMAEHQPVIDMMYERLGRWSRRQSQRVTRSDNEIIAMRGKSASKGILLGIYDGSEIDDKLTLKYRGKGLKRYVE